METGISISTGADIGQVATLAEAYALILTTAGEQRTPEAVQLAVVKAMADASSLKGLSINNCSIVGEQKTLA